MLDKNLQFLGKALLIIIVFASVNNFSLSWANNLSKNLIKDSTSDHLNGQNDPNVYAQTADVTITLEKNIPQSEKEWPNSIETAQGTMRSPQKIEEFEDMEDPFAGNEKDIPILSDPFEGYNRWMFDVNDSLYDNAVEPFVRSYRDIVNDDLRLGIRNIFNNALFPVKLLSSLIQLDLNKSGRVLVRTLINTTWGFGGIADVAGEEFGIEDVNEDLDQALGSMGIPTGPYLVLPFFGPATVRNMVGRAGDALLSPGALLSASFGQNVIINAEDNVNQISFIIDDKRELDESALDEYESVRDFYHQFRHGLLKK